MQIEIKNQGLTNSMRFVKELGETVDVRSAYNFYMPSTETLISNLHFLLENGAKEEDVKFQIENMANIYYTLWENFKGYKKYIK